MKIKKFTSILLSALMISAVSVGVTAKEISSKDYEKPNSAVIPTETVVEETTNDKGETSDVTYKGGIYDGPYSGNKVRYYFTMPKEWKTFTNAKACAYWWDGTDKCTNWQNSYQMKATPIAKDNGTKVYYIDVSADVRNIVFNNGIDVGTKSGDYTSLNWGKSYQTDNISLEGYAPDESSVFPEGIDSFNNLVYIIDTDDTSINDKNGSVIFGGGWYYLHAAGNWDDKAGSQYELESVNVKLNKNLLTLNLSDKKTYKLQATIKNKRFDTKTKWLSSDEKVVKVDENGVVTAVGYGQAIISVSVHNPGESFIKSDKCIVNVVKPIVKKTSISLSKSTVSLYVKGTTTVKPIVKNGVGKTAFKSNNTKIAKVDNNGKITALKVGKAKVTVTNNKVSKVFTVIVKTPKLNKTKITLNVKKPYTLKVVGKVGKATFTSSNKKVATVNSVGKIIPKKKENTTITVKTNGVTLKCSVVVK